jgi:hypothetical protein
MDIGESPLVHCGPVIGRPLVTGDVGAEIQAVGLWDLGSNISLISRETLNDVNKRSLNAKPHKVGMSVTSVTGKPVRIKTSVLLTIQVGGHESPVGLSVTSVTVKPV